MSSTLRIGSSGNEVIALQRLLNHHLSSPFDPLIPDGDFGPLTRDRVIDFQTLNRNYPVNMPIIQDDGLIKRKPLEPDGVVGTQTLNVLLDFRTVGGESAMEPDLEKVAALGLGGARSRSAVATASPFRLANFDASPSDTEGDDPPLPPNRTIRVVQFQAGTQAAVNPWVFSPLVLTAQYTLMVKNEGKPDFLLTAGGQAALNTGSANGAWSGQGFLQMGLGGFDKAKFGRLDLANPFVQIMLAKNDGQPATVGGAIGNQINYSLITQKINGENQDILSVFLNGQVVANVGLNNGLCAAPAGQFLLGATVSVF